MSDPMVWKFGSGPFKGLTFRAGAVPNADDKIEIELYRGKFIVPKSDFQSWEQKKCVTDQSASNLTISVGELPVQRRHPNPRAWKTVRWTVRIAEDEPFFWTIEH